MIYYLMNENKEIIKDDFSYFDGALSMADEKYKIVNGYNGALYLEEYTQSEEYKQKKEQWDSEHQLKDLRNIREINCFSIINRGYLWYSQLSEQQLVELDNWYNAWLDVTKTRIIPQKPIWLK